MSEDKSDHIVITKAFFEVTGRKTSGGRPIEHTVSRLIKDGNKERAVKILTNAMILGKSVRGAAQILEASERQTFRWTKKLGLESNYIGGTNE